MNTNTNAIEQKNLSNGVMPTVEDFFTVKKVDEKKEENGEEIVTTVEVKEPCNTLSGTDTKGNPVKYVLISGDRIVTIREGKGKDVERATMESAGDQTKYLSSMMAACTTIEGKPVTMYALAELKMKDYTAVQIAFAELNF